MANKPNIRFKGFTDEWKKAPLSDYLVVSSERNINNQYTAEDVQSVSGEYGVVNQIEFQGRSFAGTSLLGYRVIHHGEIAYTKSPLKQSPYGIIKANKIEAGIVSSLYGVYKVKNGYANFIQDYFDLLSRLNGYLRPLVNKGAKNTLLITDEDAISGDVIFPNEAEQKEVSKIIESISASITQREKELEKLKNIKRALLEKLFPQNGSKVPALRFKEFAEEWEDNVLEDVYYRCIEKNDLSFGPDKIISVANMFYRSEVSNSSDDYMRTYNIMRLGDIAYEGNKSINYAYGRWVENDIGDGIVSHVFEVLRPKCVYDLLYWKYAINNEYIMRKLLLRSTKKATMMTNVVVADFLRQKILIPTIYEQNKIGKLLAKFDHLLSLREKQLTLLKHTKQALLEQMFVNE